MIENRNQLFVVEVGDGGVQSEPVAEEVGVQALVDVRNKKS